ncbi:MAG: hypothetical protein KF730_10200 [Sphingomonas sp.]|uniref:hypothetical protein n=1 Tax=Sphingomonas sp. TaxID=28214 RepID=UPI0025E8110D|nr:hypothetical protein [Sphingomonas sp.]MBX3564933.1 hypothetical protein [Sphingomonas sp.]
MTTLQIDLPDFAAMPDDEVERHPLARTKDGRWSTQTRRLLEQLGTGKLDLNEAWAQTWTDWECPCCRRRKSDIARLTDAGVLLCQLDWHHDHLEDAAGAIMRAMATAGIDGDLLVTRKRACSAARPLIARFAPVLLCNDCNAADAAMKARLGSVVPPAFSFSPKEIAQFIKPRPNSSHALDEAKGGAVWPQAFVEFEDRMAFANLMGERIAAGQHDQEIYSFSDPSRDFEDSRLLLKLAYEAGGARNRPSGLGEALLARSRSTAGRAMTGARKSSAKIRIPTADEFCSVDTANSLSLPWRNAGPDWRCLGCGRSKFEILRLSNKGKWRAAIMLLNDYRAEENPESRDRRDRGRDLPVVLAEHRQVGVCHDCRQIVTDAISARPGVEQDSLRLSDLMVLTRQAVPHASHRVDRDFVFSLVEANAGWLMAVKDYWAHREEAHAISFESYRLMRNTGLSEAAARNVLIPRLVAAGRLPSQASAAWFDWLIAESARLSKAKS